MAGHMRVIGAALTFPGERGNTLRAVRAARSRMAASVGVLSLMKFPLILAAGIALLLGVTAHATTYYLDAATGSWNSASSWTTDPANAGVNSAVPTITDLATFNDTALNTTAAAVTLDAPQAVLGIVVNTTGTVSLNAGTGGTANTLTLGASGINMTTATTLTIGASTSTAEPIALAASQSWSNNTSGSTSIIINSAVSSSAAAGATLTLNGSQNNTGAVNQINGIISDGSGPVSLTMSSPSNGLRWYVNGGNTYTGVTTISNGALTIGNASALGATGAASGTTVAANSSVFFRSTIGTVGETLTIAGSGATSGTGALRNVGGTNTWSGPISTSAAATIGADVAQLTISGNITANNALTFVEGAASVLGTIVVQGNISGAGAVTETKSASTGASANLIFSTNAKTYTGVTTVSSGVLTLNTALSNTSAVNVNSSGTLTGNGGSINTVASTSINGTLSPGSTTAGSIGTLSTGSLSLSPGAAATFALDINTSGGTPTHDTVNVTGNLTLGTGFNTALTVTDAGSVVLPIGTVIPFMTYTGTYNGGLFYVGGTAITDNGNTFTAGPNNFQISYDNNTVELIAAGVVPEPSAWLSVLGGCGMLLGFSRRRRCGI